MDLPWLHSLETSWLASKSQDRLPHAVMLLGAPGSGKRCAAAWMAATFLDLDVAQAHAQFPPGRPEHADLRWISPPEDKHTIGIEQIRALVADLSLTSYEGKGKVAIIDPANAMTANAANSLLKGNHLQPLPEAVNPASRRKRGPAMAASVAACDQLARHIAWRRQCAPRCPDCC